MTALFLVALLMGVTATGGAGAATSGGGTDNSPTHGQVDAGCSITFPEVVWGTPGGDCSGMMECWGPQECQFHVQATITSSGAPEPLGALPIPGLVQVILEHGGTHHPFGGGPNTVWHGETDCVGLETCTLTIDPVWEPHSLGYWGCRIGNLTYAADVYVSCAAMLEK